MLSASSFVDVELLVAIALAVWVLVTRPQLGPGSVPGALAFLLGVAVLGWFVPNGVTAALALPHGLYLALLGCVLPALFALVLAAGWVVRALLDSALAREPAEERVRRSSRHPF